MSRIVITCCLLLGCTSWAVAAEERRAELDWSNWQKIPILDQGRLKPLDTFAEETVVLVTGRASWTDPETERKYRAPELLYLWVTAPDDWTQNDWTGNPIIRCEFRPLRELLGVKTEGTFIAVADFVDLAQSQLQGTLVAKSQGVQERLLKLMRAGNQGKQPGDVGETPEEKRISAKLAELIHHTRAFLSACQSRQMYVVPGLDPRTLSVVKDPDARLRPWIPLGALLQLEDWRNQADVTIVTLVSGGKLEALEALMSRNYPTEHVLQMLQAGSEQISSRLLPALREIKPSLVQTRAHYDRGEADKFARSMRTFVKKLSTLASALEQARPSMGPLKENPPGIAYDPLELSDAQMALSAYPAAGSTDLEVFFNRVQPFNYAWMFFFTAAVALVVSAMVKVQKSAYLLGLSVSLAAIVFATWGFGLRIAIAGRPPVTNMYETVIWVAYVVACLGLWFGILPLIWPGLQWSWRLTAIPLSWESRPLGSGDDSKIFSGVSAFLGSGFSVARIAGFVSIVWFLTSSDTSFSITTLTPPRGAVQLLSIGSLLTWCVGITTVLTAAWFLPRSVLAVAFSPMTIVPEIRRVGLETLMTQSLSRRFFTQTAMVVAGCGMLLAYQVGMTSRDILDPSIGRIAAVLRNNYWLTIHVLTIVSSYGAGALAWGLGNLALGYYLLGRYRAPERSGLAEKSAAKSQAMRETAAAPKFEPGAGKSAGGDGLVSRLKKAGRGLAPGRIGQTLKAGFSGGGDEHLKSSHIRPPSEVSTLAGFTYKTMQVAVLLLAAGTILGGLWADVSWGRFWDWDPKEVWALISLLVYLVVLHARYAGLVGTFGTNLCGVLCFNAILMSWYGVNFVLPQIHGWWNGTGVATEVGLHSYAPGEAKGVEYILGAVILNACFALAAWGRYATETIFFTKQAADSQHAG